MHQKNKLRLSLQVVGDHKLDETRKINGSLPAQDGFSLGGIAQ